MKTVISELKSEVSVGETSEAAADREGLDASVAVHVAEILKLPFLHLMGWVHYVAI